MSNPVMAIDKDKVNISEILIRAYGLVAHGFVMPKW